jgi:hypothetical protein
MKDKDKKDDLFKNNSIFITQNNLVKVKYMFLKYSFIILFFTLLITACKSEDSEDTSTNEKVKQEIDSTSVLDTTKTTPKKIEVVSKKEEKKEIHQKIVAKYGEQWDFCSCVTANDSINKAFEKNLTDKQSEKLMVRWEYVENKCKEFLTTPNTTPEQRLEHELKVKKCLKSAGRK